MRGYRLRLLTVAVLLTAASARAFAADPDDDWTPYQAPVATGTVLAPTTPEGGFGAPDRQSFDAKLRSRVLDQLCRHIQLNHDFNFGPQGFEGTSVGLSRYLATYPDNSLAVVDDEKLKIAYAHGFSKELNGVGAGAASLGLSLGGSIEGHTMVVRRLASQQTCAEVRRLADFRDIKTVMPVTAKRIAAMKLGELWRIPFTLTYYQGLGLNETRPMSNPADSSAFSVSFGRSDSGAASMTLYRIADDKVRFRFRIDHVVVHSSALGVVATFPAAVFAANAQNILLRFVEQQVANQLGKYTTAWMSWGRASSDGARVLMEFVVDPRDPAQAEALAKATRGDLGELVKMGARMSTLHADDQTTLKDYAILRGDHAKTLGDPTYAAADQYATKTHSFSLNIPFLIKHDATTLFGSDRVLRYTGAQGEFQFYRADKSKTNDYFNAPFLGPLAKNSSQRDAEAVTFAPKGRPHGAPILVYLRNQGYLRQSASEVRGDLKDINDVMELAGRQRGSRAASVMLPVDTLIPPVPKKDSSAAFAKSAGQDAESGDRKGWFSFTLVFNQKAVKDMLNASTGEVLRAFAASLNAGAHMGMIDQEDRPLAEWLADHATLDAKGRLVYDRDAARRAFPEDEEPPVGTRINQDSPERQLDLLSRKAAGLLADLKAARDAQGNAARADKIAVLVGGTGESGLAYEDVLRVLVQLVDPLDLTGDFVSNIDGTSKGVKSSDAHLVLKKDRAEVPMLKDAGDAKSRFAQPSILTD